MKTVDPGDGNIPVLRRWMTQGPGMCTLEVGVESVVIFLCGDRMWGDSAPDSGPLRYYHTRAYVVSYLRTSTEVGFKAYESTKTIRLQGAADSKGTAQT